MTSLFARRTTAPPSPTALALVPTLEARLQTATEAIPGLEARRRSLLLDADNGIEGAADELASVSQALADARRTAADVRDMLAVAREREAVKNAAAREALRQSQLASCRQHLRLRDSAAERFATAQAEAIAAWRELLVQSDRARAACPVGSTWPLGGLTTPSELHVAVESELDRLDSAFPGARRADLRQPSEPLAERLHTSSRNLMAAIGGQP